VNKFAFLTPDDVFYANVSLVDIVNHVINFHVVLTIVVSEYKNGYSWLLNFE
jgi:hypothetical protein